MRKILAGLASVAFLLAMVVAAPAAEATPPKDCLPGCYLAQATVNTWQNTQPTGSSTRVQLVPGGDYYAIRCYVSGQSVNGDAIWYWGRYNGLWGYVAGYYLATGHDPRSGTPHC